MIDCKLTLNTGWDSETDYFSIQFYKCNVMSCNISSYNRNILIICWCTILKMLLKSKMCAYIEIHIPSGQWSRCHCNTIIKVYIRILSIGGQQKLFLQRIDSRVMLKALYY